MGFIGYKYSTFELGGFFLKFGWDFIKVEFYLDGVLSASRFKEEIDVGIMGIVVVFLIKDVRLPPLNIVYRREWALIHDGGVDMCFEVRILLRFLETCVSDNGRAARDETRY